MFVGGRWLLSEIKAEGLLRTLYLKETTNPTEVQLLLKKLTTQKTAKEEKEEKSKKKESKEKQETNKTQTKASAIVLSGSDTEKEKLSATSEESEDEDEDEDEMDDREFFGLERKVCNMHIQFHLFLRNQRFNNKHNISLTNTHTLILTLWFRLNWILRLLFMVLEFR
jgi:hypothetical protein